MIEFPIYLGEWMTKERFEKILVSLRGDKIPTQEEIQKLFQSVEPQKPNFKKRLWKQIYKMYNDE